MYTLFVLDDDIVFQRLMKLMFIRYPVFKLVLYYNESKPLLNYLAEYKNDCSNLPDIIFLDLSMPVVDGWKVLNAIEKLYPSLCKKIEVYVVTVSIMEKDKERALAYPFVKEFISKPIYKDKLISICYGVNVGVDEKG